MADTGGDNTYSAEVAVAVVTQDESMRSVVAVLLLTTDVTLEPVLIAAHHRPQVVKYILGHLFCLELLTLALQNVLRR